MKALPADADYDAWREAARPFLARRISPDRVRWSNDGHRDFFADAIPIDGTAMKATVPRAFHDLASDAALHRDPGRFDLLYQLAWRLQSRPELIADATDPTIARLEEMARNVRREIHKMHAYLRFRAVGTDDGARFVAWYEPLHYVLRRALPFFVERFASMHWTILTPMGSAVWDTKELFLGPPAQRGDAPQSDAREEEWRAYYENIFNPARLNMQAMLRHVPRRFWANMPETASVPDLIRSANARTEEMIAAAPAQMQRKLGRLEAAATAAAKIDPEAAYGGAAPGSIGEMKGKLPQCRACPLYKNATQVVPGEGPADATVMLVGEQPGDQEDLQGRPFVGPAGKVLDDAIAEAGLDRGRLYITNAVKHFKYELRGKRRLHKPPNAGEVTACKWWLDAERKLIKPKVILTLGATALTAIAGPKATLKQFRNALHPIKGGDHLATYHPSYILRIPDEAEKKAALKQLTDDLKRVRQMMER